MRNIKPHKGGRTEIIPPCRVTPEEKLVIDKARRGLSYSDFIVRSAKIKLKHTSRQKAK